MMLHVLIVDDEWLDLEGLRDQIPRLLLPPMEIHTAESGIHALQVIQDVPVDILITDVNMPQLSGIDLAGIVKEKYPDAEILFVSGYDDFEYARQALALSAVWYLLKPVQDDELLTALLRAVSRLGAKGRGEESPAVQKSREELLTDQVCQYVFAHLSERITLADIAGELHYSANHLGKIVQEVLGMNFSAYLQKTRLSYAAHLLREKKQMGVGEIAHLTGYTSSDSFARVFRQEYGLTSREYRHGA